MVVGVCLVAPLARGAVLAVFAALIAIGVAEPRSALATPTFRPAVNYPAGDGSSSVAIADLTGDGQADLAVGNYDGVSVLAGRGDGSFAPATSYRVRGVPNALAIGDLNGDGRSDIAVSAGGGSTGRGGGISILLARDDGTLAPARSYRPRDASSVSLADFNADGRLDLFAADGSEWVWGLFGAGDGNFGAPVRYGAGSFPFVAVAADMNRDGRPDLVISHFAPFDVIVLLGQGDGRFKRPIKTHVGYSSVDFAVGDLNNDGRPDLVTFSGEVAVRLGLGSGRFERPLWYRAHKAPTAAAIADLDGDGRPDLAVANRHSRDVSLLIATGGGRFRRAVNYAAGVAPESVASGDVNSDGRPDLAVANKNSANVSVLLSAGPIAAAKTQAGKGRTTPR